MDYLEKIAELTQYLNARTAEYDAGHPTISDREWDDKYFELERLEKESGIIMINSPTQSIIEYSVISELQKVKHNHFMSSLAKTKDWNEFLKYFNSKDVIGMLKLDGLTCSLHYINGRLVGAETRGNGEEGENILHNAKVIKSIPKRINYRDELIVDGEVIITDSDFKPYAEEYANSRNLAAGSIRLLDSKECAKRKLTFVVWNVVKGFDETNSFLDKLVKTKSLGFTVTPWTSGFDLDAKEFLVDYAKKLGYPIDGLVGRFDDISYGESLGATSHHTNAAFAFKFYDEEESTRLKYINWSMGRGGVLTPVAVFEPVKIDGAVVERASLHNYSVMRDILGDCAYVGMPLKIFRSNMVIPQVSPVEDKYRYNYGYVVSHAGVTAGDELEFCPECHGEVLLEESDTGVLNYVCQNPYCFGKRLNRLEYFCSKSGLDIKGLSLATLEKLMDWGWVETYKDIFTLKDHFDEWVKKPGFGYASVSKILNAIEEKKTKGVPLEKMIAACGIPLIGNTVAKKITKVYSSWGAFRNAIDNKEHFDNIDTIGDVMNYELLNFDFTEIDDAVGEGIMILNAMTENQESTLDSLTFVITGKLNSYKNRDELKKLIESKGGKVVGSVSKNTNYLINNDSTSTSGKNQKAISLNIPIITEEEFKEKFL